MRTKQKLEGERHKLVQRLVCLKPDYKPPIDYRIPSNREIDKVFIPQDEHPELNFVGLLIGPRGNTLKSLEKETGAKIIIRGKGSVKDGKVSGKDGLPLPGEDEPLHAYITAPIRECVNKAIKRIKQIIQEGVETPENENDLRKSQMKELAVLNGTFRELDGLNKLKAIAEAQTIVTNTIICSLCGGVGHLPSDCKVSRDQAPVNRVLLSQMPAEKAKLDSEYSALMTELGVDSKPTVSKPLPTPSPSSSSLSPFPVPGSLAVWGNGGTVLDKESSWCDDPQLVPGGLYHPSTANYSDSYPRFPGPSLPVSGHINMLVAGPPPLVPSNIGVFSTGPLLPSKYIPMAGFVNMPPPFGTSRPI